MFKLSLISDQVRKAGIAATFALATPIAALAANTESPAAMLNAAASETAVNAGFTSTKSLPELVGAFIQQAMALLGIILVVLVIYAGFLWMTAQGNDEKIKKAKQIISSAVIGLVLIFAAYAITGFVISAITNATE